MIDLVIDPSKKEKLVDFRDDCEVLSSSSSSDTEAKKIIEPPLIKQRKVRQEETQPIDDPAELEKALPKGQNFQFIKNINP